MSHTQNSVYALEGCRSYASRRPARTATPAVVSAVQHLHSHKIPLPTPPIIAREGVSDHLSCQQLLLPIASHVLQ